MKMINLFKSLAEKAQTVIITTHLHPDADGIGSEIALCMALRKMGKQAYCINEEELMERYRYLDPDHCVLSYQDYVDKLAPMDIDLFIVTDTNSLTRIGSKVQGLVAIAKNLLFVDHHPAPPELAAIHCIDTSMAATGELVGKLVRGVGVEFDRKIALPLYTSILIDTSSFRYPTVTGNTHRLIGDLMDTGVEPPEAYNKIYGAKKIAYMKLLGTVLASACSTEDGKIAWLQLSEKTLDSFGVDEEDTLGFVNHLLILDKIKIACMFRQIGDVVKISFRSAGDVDVGSMAQALGGGGHDHSAATIISGTIGGVIAETIPKLETMLEGIELE
jgi:phosphoesterase RecJ-like protein